MEPLVTQTEMVVSQANETVNYFNLSELIFIVYLVGIGIRLIRLVLSIMGILKLKKRSEMMAHHDFTVFTTNTSYPFSFFRWVFLPKTLVDPGVIEHEAAHVRQYHWIDLLMVELGSILLWFNPLMMVYKQSLKQQHEYLADQTAIKSGIDIEAYLISIKRQIESSMPTPLTSNFYFQSIKNRINMMTKKRTSVYGLFTYPIVLPLIVCLLMAFSSSKPIQIIGIEEHASMQGEISLCLPIDKKYDFELKSGYGERMHPVLGVKRLHTGIDLVAKEGVPVVSTEDGVVIKAELAESWGNIIIIKHDGLYATSYSHLKSMNVKEGDKVEKGQEIGNVGHTGLSLQDHLHFELHKNNKAIDPLLYLPTLK